MLAPSGEGRDMNFGFSEEQDELRKMVRRFLEEKSPESEVRRLMATSEGYDPAVWAQMANELALQGLGIPEEYGGQGLRSRRALCGLRGDGRGAPVLAVFFDRGARRERAAARW